MQYVYYFMSNYDNFSFFQSPQAPDTWDGVRDASTYGSQCIQLELLLGIIMGDEGTYQLSIFK